MLVILINLQVYIVLFSINVHETYELICLLKDKRFNYTTVNEDWRGILDFYVVCVRDLATGNFRLFSFFFGSPESNSQVSFIIFHHCCLKTFMFTWALVSCLNTKKLWLKGIEVCSNALTRGDNRKIVKIHRWLFTWPESLAHGKFYQTWHKASHLQNPQNFYASQFLIKEV